MIYVPLRLIREGPDPLLFRTLSIADKTRFEVYVCHVQGNR